MKIIPPQKLWQWDINKKVYISGITDADEWQVHFATDDDRTALVLPIKHDDSGYWAYIPNQLVSEGRLLLCYLYNQVEDWAHTETMIKIPVQRRPKPAGYTLVLTDIETRGSLREDIGSLSSLTTQTQNNLVDAINEVNSKKHNDLDGRDAADVHPMSSITGLEKKLQSIDSVGTSQAKAIAQLKQDIETNEATDKSQSQAISQAQEDIDELEQSDTQLTKSVSSLAQTVDKGFKQVQTELDKKQPAGDYITNAVDNLVNYYKKSETYTRSEVKDLIGSLTHINTKIVSSIDDVTEPNVIYLVSVSGGESDDYYNEYILVNGSPELIGNTRVDLSDYYTREQTDDLLNKKQPIGSYVTSVNGTTPDENGNVSIDVQTYTAGEGIDISDSGEIAVTNPMNDEQVSAGTTWSSLNVIKQLSQPFSQSGSIITCYPVEGSPLYVVSDITAVQEGEGDPSPDNVRPISGWDGAILYVGTNEYSKDFSETVYGGTLDWTTGVLTVTWIRHTLTGNEIWIIAVDQADNSSTLSFFLPQTAMISHKDAAKCSHYITQVSNLNSFWIESTGIYGRIKVASTTIDEWKQYLSQQYDAHTPIQIAYEINQPYTIQLTPAQILAISGLNTVYCDTGDVTVTGYEDPRHTVAQLTSRIAALESAASGI